MAKNKYPSNLDHLILSGDIPPGTTFEGHLHLERKDSLQTLPIGLKVIGWLDLEGCTALKYLPEDLEVGMGLDLRGCASLQLSQGVPAGVKGVICADEAFFKSNKDYLLLMVNCIWGNDFIKDAYLKTLSDV